MIMLGLHSFLSQMSMNVVMVHMTAMQPDQSVITQMEDSSVIAYQAMSKKAMNANVRLYNAT